jgi:hypothetical protein
MLSFVYRLIKDFERTHGVAPNVLYMSEKHYFALRENLAELGHEETEAFLRLEIALTPTAHPHVSWHDPATRRRAVGEE